MKENSVLWMKVTENTWLQKNVFDYLNKQAKIAENYVENIRGFLLEKWSEEQDVDDEEVLEELGFYLKVLEPETCEEEYDRLEYEERRYYF
jgi:hypothetical protein